MNTYPSLVWICCSRHTLP